MSLKSSLIRRKKYLFNNQIKYHKFIKMSSSNFTLLWFSNCTLDQNKKLSNITKLFKRNWYSFLDHISYLIRIKTIYTGYAGPNCIVNCDSSFVISHALYFNKNMKKYEIWKDLRRFWWCPSISMPEYWHLPMPKGTDRLCKVVKVSMQCRK